MWCISSYINRTANSLLPRRARSFQLVTILFHDMLSLSSWQSFLPRAAIPIHLATAFCQVMMVMVLCQEMLGPFLPGLAAIVLACWPETAARQQQKTDRLNPKGYDLPCTAHFQIYETNEKLDGDFNYANSEFFGWILSDWSHHLVGAPLLEP